MLSAMHGDGYTVESYVLPVVLDDRAAKTSSIQKAVGVLDLRTDREVPMLFSVVQIAGRDRRVSRGEQSHRDMERRGRRRSGDRRRRGAFGDMGQFSRLAPRSSRPMRSTSSA